MNLLYNMNDVDDVGGDEHEGQRGEHEDHPEVGAAVGPGVVHQVGQGEHAERHVGQDLTLLHNTPHACTLHFNLVF